jgi:thiamine-monophosphate kinase
MGAKPRFFLLTLALPASQTGTWLDLFLQGMARAARRLGMELIGGDTTTSPRVSISITVLGEVGPGIALRRSGARPGDAIYVTGKLGRAQLGLELVMAGLGRKRRFARLVRRHLYPEVYIDLGSWLAKRKVASAMIDISDGLSTDLFRLCTASRVGARVEADRIPRVAMPDGLRRQVKDLHLDSEQMALHGGDDYALLFTVPKEKMRRLRGAPGFSKLTSIGEITGARKIELVAADGNSRRLVPAGWDPFRKN